MKEKIIIDCDPGIDDALAIFMALASGKVEVTGITTVAGNVGIENVTGNALSLVSFAGRKDIPVAKGFSGPFMVKRKDGAIVHGKSGLGNALLPDPVSEPVELEAAEFIYKKAKEEKGNLVLVTIGPLTNIAAALSMYPSLPSLIKRIVMMGGSAGIGNITPAAEFNIYADPHAAAAVFQSGIPIEMYGLDVTNRAVITAEEIKILKDSKRKVALQCVNMLNSYMDFYQSMGYEGLALHDPFAMAALIDSSIAERKDWFVAVETDGKFTRGKTVVDTYGVSGEKPNASVAYNLDRDKFISLLMELLLSYE